MSENGDHHQEEEFQRSQDDVREDDEHRRGRYEDEERDHNRTANLEGEENFSIYVTKMNFDTTEDTLRKLFEKFGEVQSASIVREPGSNASRGFGFVMMARVEDAHKAINGLENVEVDGRQIKVEKAKRRGAYEKTPGQYLGPPGLSSKFVRERERERERGRGGDRDRRRDRSRDRGDRIRERSRDRDYHRDNSRDRLRDRERDRSRDRYPPRYDDRGYPPPIGRGDDRHFRPGPFDPRGLPPFRGDPRDVRSMDPRAYDMFRGRDPRYDLDPRGLPPAYLAPPLGAYDIRPRSPVHFGGPAPGARMIDPAIAGGRAPPVAGYAASAYYAGNVGGAPGNVDRDRERERDPRDPRASGGERGGRVDDRDGRGSARDAPSGGRGGPLLQPRY